MYICIYIFVGLCFDAQSFVLISFNFSRFFFLFSFTQQPSALLSWPSCRDSCAYCVQFDVLSSAAAAMVMLQCRRVDFKHSHYDVIYSFKCMRRLSIALSAHAGRNLSFCFTGKFYREKKGTNERTNE